MFIDLFPTTILKQPLENISDSKLNSFTNYILDQKFNSAYNEGSTSSNQSILENPIFNSLKEEIIKYSIQYFNEMGFAKDNEYTFQIICSWANILEQKEYIRGHSHQNSLLSGVYYLSKKNSSILFYNTLSKKWLFNLGDKQVNNTLRSSDYFSITPLQNTLLLFPSWLPHEVLPVSDPGKRLSIAFNLIPKGKFGVSTGLCYI
jgi:uncharacterized protein (TIGR02466 family)